MRKIFILLAAVFVSSCSKPEINRQNNDGLRNYIGKWQQTSNNKTITISKNADKLTITGFYGIEDECNLLEQSNEFIIAYCAASKHNNNEGFYKKFELKQLKSYILSNDKKYETHLNIQKHKSKACLKYSYTSLAYRTDDPFNEELDKCANPDDYKARIDFFKID
ncbi:MAG: hypothetical protein GY793_03440 [Proteobacteria bacterium]|nr:hypothetical protein [Pseudomonadota bacterium]